MSVISLYIFHVSYSQHIIFCASSFLILFLSLIIQIFLQLT